VVGQEEAKRAVSVAAHAHLRRVRARRGGRSFALRKSNLLLVGPTGSGKTHLARTLAEALRVGGGPQRLDSFSGVGVCFSGQRVEC